MLGSQDFTVRGCENAAITLLRRDKWIKDQNNNNFRGRERLKEGRKRKRPNYLHKTWPARSVRMSTSDPRDQSSRVFVGGVPPGSDPKALEKVHSVLFRPASPYWGLVLVYYYTGICDVTVTKWNFQIGLVLPFKGCRSRKNWVYVCWQGDKSFEAFPFTYLMMAQTSR